MCWRWAVWSRHRPSLRRFSKPRDWDQDSRTICDIRTKSTAAMQASLERTLGPGGAGQSMPPARRAQLHYGLGQLHAYAAGWTKPSRSSRRRSSWSPGRGEGPDAADSRCSSKKRSALPTFTKRRWTTASITSLGNAACSRHGLHRSQDADLSKQAIEHFRRTWRSKPDELEVRWLLNLAYMALGAYPEKVPPAHLIPPASLAATEDVGRFVDVAPQAGADARSRRPAASIVDDFDNDGRLDVVTSSFDSCGPMRLFRRNGDGTFAERPQQAGLRRSAGRPEPRAGRLQQRRLPGHPGAARRLGVRAAQVAAAQQLRRHVHRRDRARAAWPGRRRARRPRSWADIDNDGWLDLFVGNENSAGAAVPQQAATARSRTSPKPPASTGRRSPRASRPADYDNDG